MRNRKYQRFLKGDDMKKFWVLGLIALLAIPLSCCFAVGYRTLYCEDYGYSLAIPEEWIEVPASVVEEYDKLVIEGNYQIPVQRAFQRAEAEEWLEHPFVFVYAMRYSDLGINRQLYKNELKELVEELTGLDANKVFKHTATEFRELILDYDIGEAYLDSEKKVYVWRIEMNVDNLGRVKTSVVGHFGRRAVIQMGFFDLKSNWNQSKPERDLILESFHFDPAMTYSEAYGNRPSIPDWAGRAFAKGAGTALFFSIIALFVGGIGIVARKIRLKKDKPPKDEQNDK